MSSKTATPLKAAKNADGQENTEIETIEINCAGENYEIQSLILKKGTLLYNRSSPSSAGTDVTLWFGIKKEDVEPYGNILSTYEVENPIRILLLDSEQTDNFKCIELLIPNLMKLIDSNWKSGRYTTREGDFPVVNRLSEKLPDLGIDGIGTGRGIGYIDAPEGHHSEVALFPNVWEDKLKLKSKETEEMRVAPPVRRPKKRSRAAGGSGGSGGGRRAVRPGGAARKLF